jgi:hypothetical protein
MGSVAKINSMVHPEYDFLQELTKELKQTIRAPLLERMKVLKNEKKDCSHCIGHCCTEWANSMMITPLETWQMYNELIESQRWTKELETSLTDCVKRYRLDQIPGDGKKNFLRRTYRCPFYTEPGCSIPPESKPLGCLAFNPHRPEEKEGTECWSEIKYLENVETLIEQQLFNAQKKVQDIFQLSFKKAPIPLALLEMHQKFTRAS